MTEDKSLNDAMSQYCEICKKNTYHGWYDDFTYDCTECGHTNQERVEPKTDEEIKQINNVKEE